MVIGRACVCVWQSDVSFTSVYQPESREGLRKVNLSSLVDNSEATGAVLPLSSDWVLWANQTEKLEFVSLYLDRRARNN